MSRRLMTLLILCGLLLVAWIAWIAWIALAEQRERADRPRASLQRDEAREAVLHRDEAGVEDRADARTAILKGTVRGPDGPLWAVAVTAEPLQEGMLRGSGGTKTDGAFRLELEAPGSYQLTFSPDPATGIPATTRIVSDLQAGEERILDLDLSRLPETSGRIFPPLRTKLAAIRAADFEAAHATAATPAAELSSLFCATAVTTHAGRFEFRSLAPGDYYLLPSAERRRFRELVRFHSGDANIRAELVGVFDLRIRARDFETGAEIGEFLLQVRDEVGDLLAEVPFRNGKPESQVLYAVPLGFPVAVIRAEGFEEGHVSMTMLDHGQHVLLLRRRPPNLRLHLRYEDGGDVSDVFRFEVARYQYFCSGNLALFDDGTRVATLPVGTWSLLVWRENMFQTRADKEAVEIGAEGMTDVRLDLKRGGTLVVECPRDGEWNASIMSKERVGDWLVRKVVPGAKSTVEDLLPGRYVCEITRRRPRAAEAAPPTREFTIVGTETVVLDFAR